MDYERLNKLIMDPFESFTKAGCKTWFRYIKVYICCLVGPYMASSRCLGKPANETSSDVN